MVIAATRNLTYNGLQENFYILCASVLIVNHMHKYIPTETGDDVIVGSTCSSDAV